MTKDNKEKIVKFREDGLSLQKIGKKFGVSKQRVWQILNYEKYRKQANAYRRTERFRQLRKNMVKNNKIILGDCLEEMIDIKTGSIDMILCDLPYGTTACKWDTIIPFEPLWEQYKRVIKDNGAIILTASQPFTSALVMSNVKMFKCEWIWNKEKGGSCFLAKYQPMKVHENILVFGKGKINYYPQMTKAEEKNKRNGGKLYPKRDTILGSIDLQWSKNHDENVRFPKSFINIKSSEKECNNALRVHPTQKPVALFEYLIKTYTNEGDLVLDNCAGSGTTGIACQNLNRNYILIEKEKKYINIIKERLK